MFFREPKRIVTVKPGSIYRLARKHNMVEVAEVVSVVNDKSGIPHVRYLLRFDHRYCQPSRDSRMLSLSSFADRYDCTERTSETG